MGVQVFGLIEGEPVETVSDKNVNPAVTCKAEGEDCQAALEANMAGQGWKCSKAQQCYLEISLGQNYDLTGFSVK